MFPGQPWWSSELRVRKYWYYQSGKQGQNFSNSLITYDNNHNDRKVFTGEALSVIQALLAIGALFSEENLKKSKLIYTMPKS